MATHSVGEKREKLLNSVNNSNSLGDLSPTLKNLNIDLLKHWMTQQIKDAPHHSINCLYFNSSSFQNILCQDLRIQILSFFSLLNVSKLKIICKQFKKDCNVLIETKKQQILWLYNHKSLQLIFTKDFMDTLPKIGIPLLNKYDRTSLFGRYGQWNGQRWKLAINGIDRETLELCKLLKWKMSLQTVRNTKQSQQTADVWEEISFSSEPYDYCDRDSLEYDLYDEESYDNAKEFGHMMCNDDFPGGDMGIVGIYGMMIVKSPDPKWRHDILKQYNLNIIDRKGYKRPPASNANRNQIDFYDTL